jgi:magnesium-transporting ATPase (P-type)
LLQSFAWSSLDAHSKSIQALRAALGALPSETMVEVVDQIPFKSQNRYSAVRLRGGDDERVLVLGAFEVLRSFLSEQAAGDTESAWQDLLGTGLRLLLFAVGPGTQASRELPPFQGALPSMRLQPLALVALSDELRPEAGAVLEALARQGIGFKILSGDNPETVRATVAHLELPLAAEPVVSGDQLAVAHELESIVLAHSVFGRVTPQQKLGIVTLLQAQGRRVAMLGDGVNDILPIKRADLGIAMGEGSPATRTVAGLVLENNNFELLPATLDEGRTIVRNIRRAAKLFLLKNVYTLLLIVAGPGLLGLPFPYLPQHVTLLDALTIGVPAFFLMLGRHPSGQPIRPGFLREVGWFALSTGLVMGSAGLAVFLLARWRGEDEQTQRTMLLSTLIVQGLLSVLRLLADREGPPGWADRCLRLWVVVALPLYAGVMYLPLTGYFFELTPLRLAQWSIVLALSLPALALSMAFSRLGLAFTR